MSSKGCSAISNTPQHMKTPPSFGAEYPNSATKCVADESAPKAPIAESLPRKKRAPIFTMCALFGPTVVVVVALCLNIRLLTLGEVFMLSVFVGVLCSMMAFYRNEAWARLSLLGIPILVVLIVLALLLIIWALETSPLDL